jgi:uncharacterized protein (DUF4213/DUF364 family)
LQAFPSNECLQLANSITQFQSKFRVWKVNALSKTKELLNYCKYRQIKLHCQNQNHLNLIGNSSKMICLKRAETLKSKNETKTEINKCLAIAVKKMRFTFKVF